MKLDQETLAKHQFWFLLGGYALLWLVAVLWMKFTYPDDIKTRRDKYEASAKAVKDELDKGPVNTTTFLPPWEQETKLFSDHKGVIWKEAWDVQKDMYDWPQEWYKKYDMTTPQAPLSSDDRTEYKDKLYSNQIDYWRTYAPKWLSPIELKDGFDNVFNPKKDWRETPTREEVWLAQEDFWVKRELLIDVYSAMALQAIMVPVPIDEKESMPKGVEARYRFRNKNWEITLNIRKNDRGFVIGGDSTIKNIHPSRQPQPLTSAKGRGIWFNIAQDNLGTTFEVRGEPVSWNDKKNFSEENYPEPLYGIKWDKDWLKDHPIRVSQGFDQSNCPIRRINAIELAKQDCRTVIWPLQPNHQLAQLDASPEDEKKADAAGTGAAPAGMPGAPGGSMPGGGGNMMKQAMMGGPMGPGAGAAQAGNPTPNNDIERNRYLQPKEQDKSVNPPSHHLPLAIQLIVEQSHMNDVMVALANSRLRFQITQVEFDHVKDYVPQSEGDKDKKDAPDRNDPRVFTGGMPSMGGAGMQGQMMMRQQMMQRMQQQQPGGGADMQRQMRMRQQMMQGMMQGGGSGGPPNMGGSARGGPNMPPSPYMKGGMGSPMRPPGPGAPAQSRFTYAPGGIRPGMGPTTGGTVSNQMQSNQADDNLAELTIYGIATLYRAPDVPQTTAPTGQSPAPAGQTAPQPAAPATPPSATAPQPPVAPAKQANTASPAPAATKEPSGAATPPGKAAPKDGGSLPPAPKQPDKSGDPKKTPPPPPPADAKR